MKTQVMQLKKKDGNMTQNDQEAAEVLCECFKEVFVAEDETDNASSKLQVQEKGMRIDTSTGIVFTEEMVMNKLTRLHSRKSPGPDNLHPHLLKQCAENLAGPLSRIFQRSFVTEDVPSGWRLANVYVQSSKWEEKTRRATTDQCP